MMKNIRTRLGALLLCGAVWLASLPASVLAAETGRTLHVDAAGENDAFISLHEAVHAAADGDTIVLASDVELDSKLLIEKKLTLDGGGHTVSASGGFAGSGTAGAQWAQENGISDGANLHRPVTREQLAAMLYRYAGEPEASGDLGLFADAGSVSPFAEKAMAWAVETGLFNGTGNNALAPQSTATRAQVAAVLARFAAAAVR